MKWRRRYYQGRDIEHGYDHHGEADAGGRDDGVLLILMMGMIGLMMVAPALTVVAADMIMVIMMMAMVRAASHPPASATISGAARLRHRPVANLYRRTAFHAV